MKWPLEKMGERNPLFGLRNIRKSFNHSPVIEGLNLDLYAGDFTLLLGANASGKSTLLRICCGLVRPEAGGNFWRGRQNGDAHSWQTPPAGMFAHAGHKLHLYSLLTVAENLALTQTALGLEINLADYLQIWRLEEAARQNIRSLSRGIQSRVSLARALMHKPALIFLDEPTSCLDDASLELLLRYLEEARKTSESSIMIATHDLGRLASFASRIVVIGDKRICRDSLAVEEQEGLPGAIAREKCLEYYRAENR